MTRHLFTAIVTLTLGLGAASTAAAQELVPQLEIAFDTNVANAGGILDETHWRPRNLVAVWVTMLNELEEEVLVKTVFQAQSGYKIHLLNFRALVPPDDLDGISGATRANHIDPVVATWDLTDQLGEPVEPGIYTVHAEIVDCNADAGVLDCEPTYAVFDYELLEEPIEDPAPVPQIFDIIQTNVQGGLPPALENATTSYQLVAAPEEDDPGTGGGDGSGGGDGDGAGGGGGNGGVPQDGRDPTVTAGCSASATSASSGELAGLLAVCGLILAFGLRRRRETSRD